jgi:AraC family transcriptional regulator
MIGVYEMNFRIEKKDSFRIVGVSEPLQKGIEKNFEAVPRMWENAVIDGTLQKLAAMMDSSPKGILGICVCDDSEDWRYFIAVASTQEIGGTLEQYTVPALNGLYFPAPENAPPQYRNWKNGLRLNGCLLPIMNIITVSR